MSQIDNVKFSSLLFTRQTDTVFAVQANFDFDRCSLRVVDAGMPAYNEYNINFDEAGSEELNSEITFGPQLDNPGPNPEVQNAVEIKFYDITAGQYSSKKGYTKGRENGCPPPGSATMGALTSGGLNSLGARIKTVNLVRTGGDTQVTVTTENINGGSSGYRIIANMEHIIQTTSGPVHTWAFEMEDGLTSDVDNVFQFDFSSVLPEVGLPLLFFAQGTDINSVNQSDALVWIEQ